MFAAARYALRTDQFVQPPSVRFQERPGYTVVHTEDRPDYWSGHFLQLDRCPEPGELPSWLDVWKRELGTRQGLEKVFLRCEVDGSPDLTRLETEARSAGLALEALPVLLLTTPREPAPSAWEPRPFRDAADWSALEELLISEFTPSGTPADFLQWQISGHRQRVEAGHGEWWGIWDGAGLVGTAGIFWKEGWARFQEVVTRETHRRRGICATLCHHMAAAVRSSGRASKVVIIAEPGSGAERVYRSLGFEPVSTRLTLWAERARLAGASS